MKSMEPFYKVAQEAPALNYPDVPAVSFKPDQWRIFNQMLWPGYFANVQRQRYGRVRSGPESLALATYRAAGGEAPLDQSAGASWPQFQRAAREVAPDLAPIYRGAMAFRGYSPAQKAREYLAAAGPKDLTGVQERMWQLGRNEHLLRRRIFRDAMAGQRARRGMSWRGAARTLKEDVGRGADLIREKHLVPWWKQTREGAGILANWLRGK